MWAKKQDTRKTDHEMKRGIMNVKKVIQADISVRKKTLLLKNKISRTLEQTFKVETGLRLTTRQKDINWNVTGGEGNIRLHYQAACGERNGQKRKDT